MYVYANASAIVAVDGVTVTVREGQRFDAGDPIVAQHRGLFSGDVEEATAVPGQRRNASKP